MSDEEMNIDDGPFPPPPIVSYFNYNLYASQSRTRVAPFVSVDVVSKIREVSSLGARPTVHHLITRIGGNDAGVSSEQAFDRVETTNDTRAARCAYSPIPE